MRASLGIGVALFGAAFASAGWAMTSLDAPEFSVLVDAASSTAPEGDGQWRVDVTPAADRDRLTATLDRAVALTLRPDGEATIVAPLSGLSPGHHFIEAEVARTGGRLSRVVDTVVAGPFQQGRDRGCDVALALAPQVVRLLLLPAIERKVVDGAAGLEEFFGPTSYIKSSELTVVEGGVRVAVTLDTKDEDKGDLVFAGVVHAESVADGGIALRLAELEEATPGPKLERIAKRVGAERGTAAGAGGGGTVGAFVGGPIGALVGVVVGGAAGNYVGGRLGKRKAKAQTRSEVLDALTDGLAIATQELKLPSQLELVPLEPALHADVQWCGPLTLDPEDGLHASFSIEVDDDAFTDRAQALAIWHPPALSKPEVGDAFGVHATVGSNAINRLLAEWTVRGGFTEVLSGAGIARAVEAELGARTRWKVEGIDAGQPPSLTMNDGALAASIGGVALTLVDGLHDRRQQVVVGGTGTLQIGFSDRGSARVSGRLDEAYFGCRLPSAEGRRLPACFSAAVDPALVRKKINLAIMVNAARLPAFDLAELLAVSLTAVEGQALSIHAPSVTVESGALRLKASVRPPP